VDGQKREGTYRVKALNVSEGGIFVATDLPLGIGTEVHLEFHVPNQRESFRALGKVVWSGATDTGETGEISGKAIQFTKSTEQCRQQLINYVAEYKKT
jgi:uncharacterized protein (TIGR02266 family)